MLLLVNRKQPSVPPGCWHVWTALYNLGFYRGSTLVESRIYYVVNPLENVPLAISFLGR